MTFEDVVDLRVDESFNVFINHRGDLAGVKGRAAFEQELIIRLTERMRGLIGQPDVGEDSLRELARSYAERVASEMDVLDSVASFAAEFSDEEFSTMDIELVYDTGEVLEFSIQS